MCGSLAVKPGYGLLGDGDGVARLPVAIAAAGLSMTHWADGDSPYECNHSSGANYEATRGRPVHWRYSLYWVSLTGNLWGS